MRRFAVDTLRITHSHQSFGQVRGLEEKFEDLKETSRSRCEEVEQRLGADAKRTLDLHVDGHKGFE